MTHVMTVISKNQPANLAAAVMGQAAAGSYNVTTNRHKQNAIELICLVCVYQDLLSMKDLFP